MFVPRFLASSQLNAGDVKTTIVVEDWQFCVLGLIGCTSSGAYIDVTFTIQGSGEVSYDTASLHLSFAGSGSVYLLDVVEVDGQFQTMASGYPSVALSQGDASVRSSASVTVRIPKGSKVKYDPVLRRTDSSSNSQIAGEAQIGVFMEAMEEGGLFKVGEESTPSQDPNAISVRLASATEVDSSGNTIQVTAGLAHTVSAFADMGFAVGGIQARAFADLSASAAVSVTVRANPIVGSSANVALEGVYMKEDGMATIGSGSAMSTIDLKAGDVQFVVHVDDWAFCSSSMAGCSTSGAAIDVVLEFKASGGATV